MSMLLFDLGVLFIIYWEGCLCVNLDTPGSSGRSEIRGEQCLECSIKPSEGHGEGDLTLQVTLTLTDSRKIDSKS